MPFPFLRSLKDEYFPAMKLESSHVRSLFIQPLKASLKITMWFQCIRAVGACNYSWTTHMRSLFSAWQCAAVQKIKMKSSTIFTLNFIAKCSLMLHVRNERHKKKPLISSTWIQISPIDGTISYIYNYFFRLSAKWNAFESWKTTNPKKENLHHFLKEFPSLCLKIRAHSSNFPRPLKMPPHVVCCTADQPTGLVGKTSVRLLMCSASRQQFLQSLRRFFWRS